MTIREYHSPQFGVLRFAETKDGDYLPFVSDITRALEYSCDSVTLYNVSPKYWIKLEDDKIAITMDGFNQLISQSRKKMKRTLEYVVKQDAIPLFKVHDHVNLVHDHDNLEPLMNITPQVIEDEKNSTDHPTSLIGRNFALLDDRDDVNYMDIYSMLTVSQFSERNGIPKGYILNWLCNHYMIVNFENRYRPTINALESGYLGVIQNRNVKTGRFAMYKCVRDEIRKDYENGK